MMFAALVCSAAGAQPRTIDAAKSTMTIHVYKTGMLSALGHDHEISAALASGTVDIAERKVELTVNAATLRVQDPKASGKDREEVQANMLGAAVLDVENHKEIRFHSTAADPAGPGIWKLRGDLTLRGTTHPVALDVHERDGHYVGTCRLNVTDFDIKPIKAAGGAIRVKDEIAIDFDIQLVR
ncbi:MAG: YceI family protein [Ignavibacteriota bacterium]